MFRVGMKVVCIKYDPETDIYAPPIKVRGIYTVSWIGIFPPSGDPSIDLLEFPMPETDDAWRGYTASHFRPLVERKASIEIFTKMLTPTGENANV